MARTDPSYVRASAPLLVSKLGPELSRFTVNLRADNRSTVRYKFTMPSIGQGFFNVAEPGHSVTFDPSYGY